MCAPGKNGDGFKVVEPGQLAFTIGGSYPEFPDNCFLTQLSTTENALQLLADRAQVNGKKLGHQLLRQPPRFVRVTGLDTLIAGLSCEDQELGRAVADQFFLAVSIISPHLP